MPITRSLAIAFVSGAFLLSTRPDASSNQRENRAPDPVSITFCDLVKSPDLYNETVVRTSAILVVGPEHTILYDPACMAQSNLTWLEWTAYSQALKTTKKGVRKKLDSYLKSEDRVRIRVLGTFEARPKIEVPKDLSPEVAAAVRRNNEQAGFGHLGCCPHQLVPIGIENVERVPKSTPRP